jgi:hypothetical protein
VAEQTSVADRPSQSTLVSSGASLVADLRSVLPSWIAARIIVALAFLLAHAIVEHYVVGGTTGALDSGLFAWDGSFYRDLAHGGYASLPPDALRFFPLYPLLGRYLGFGAGSSVALVIIANVASLAAGVLVRRLVLFEGRSVATADRAVWITNLFPASFVLVWAYAEAVFLVLALGTFFAVRRRRFALAAGLAFLAALTRPVGVLLAAPLAIEAIRAWRADGVLGTRQLARLAGAAAPVVGFGAFLVWVGHTFGDAFAPLTAQSALRGEANPVSRLFRGVGDMFGDQRFGDGLHIPFVIAFVLLLIVVWRRWPLAYSVYASLVLVVALSADNLNSVERYALNAFPLLFAIADLTSTVRRERVALAICGSGLLGLCALAWLSIYVP